MATTVSHTRSNSFPSSSHPLAKRFEEELHVLKTQASFTSQHQAISSTDLCSGLAGLVQLHTSLRNLLKMPQAQAVLGKNKHGRWVAEELDGSVRLLDICSSTREALCSMKESGRELRSALRTRKIGDCVFQRRVESYISSRKNARKEMHAFIKTLVRMEESCELCPVSDDSNEVSTLIVSTLKKARAMTIAVYRSILCFFFKPDSSSGWSLLSKVLMKRSISRVSCEAYECSREFESLDATIYAMGKKESIMVDTIRMKQQLLQLEAIFDGVVMGLESLFQSLIKNRVSLLNILNV